MRSFPVALNHKNTKIQPQKNDILHEIIHAKQIFHKFIGKWGNSIYIQIEFPHFLILAKKILI